MLCTIYIVYKYKYRYLSSVYTEIFSYAKTYTRTVFKVTKAKRPVYPRLMTHATSR